MRYKGWPCTSPLSSTQGTCAGDNATCLSSHHGLSYNQTHPIFTEKSEPRTSLSGCVFCYKSSYSPVWTCQPHVENRQVTALFSGSQDETTQIEPILRVCNCKYYLICLRHLIFFQAICKVHLNVHLNFSHLWRALDPVFSAVLF